MSKDPIEGRIKKLLETEALYKSLFYDCPVPCWHKEYDKRSDRFFMDTVNEAYTEATGISIEAYEGQPDPMLWEDETAGIFFKNDLHVIKTRVVLPIEELLNNPKTGTPQFAVGWKWPHIVGRRIVGIWGMAHLHEADVWMDGRENHPFYKAHKAILDHRWKELYGEQDA